MIFLIDTKIYMCSINPLIHEKNEQHGQRVDILVLFYFQNSFTYQKLFFFLFFKLVFRDAGFS